MSILGRDLPIVTWNQWRDQVIIVDPYNYYPVLQLNGYTFTVIGDHILFDLTIRSNIQKFFTSDKEIAVISVPDPNSISSLTDIFLLLSRGLGRGLTNQEAQTWVEGLLQKGYLLADSAIYQYPGDRKIISPFDKHFSDN